MNSPTKVPWWRKWLQSLAIAILSMPLVLIVVYFGAQAIAAVSQGYSWAEMDWNSDGVTWIVEFFESSDIGKKPVAVNGRHCTDYFWFKDGLTVRLDCR